MLKNHKRYSQAAIAYTMDPKYHEKMKHTNTKYNFVKEILYIYK